MQKHLILVLMIMTCLACNKTPDPDQKSKSTPAETNIPKKMTPVEQFVSDVQQSHNLSKFNQNDAIQFDINLQFGKSKTLEAKISMTTNSSKVVLQTADGTTIYYHNGKFYKHPPEANYPSARFDVLTWAYFFAMPLKLNDQGTQWQNLQTRQLEATTYDSAKLTFAANTGDAPDDWYIVYADKTTHLLKAAAYIVTFSKSQEQAEENPHAIVYNRYFSVGKIPFASQWQFYNWSKEQGIYGDPIGEASIKNVRFISADHPVFNRQEAAQQIK